MTAADLSGLEKNHGGTEARSSEQCCRALRLDVMSAFTSGQGARAPTSSRRAVAPIGRPLVPPCLRASVFNPAARSDGFTLLEVMVALAILGLALTAILSAQAGLYSANVQARNLSYGTSAARCKMNEVEIELLTRGYPEADQTEEGPCCAAESPPGMSCKWVVERVTLPDPPQTDPTKAGDGGVGGGLAGGLGGGGLGALAGLAANPGGLADGGLGALSSALSAPVGPGGQTGVTGVAGMALTMVYPQLKPLLEASIRRVTVDVLWHEGPVERRIRIVQFVTNPQKGIPPIDPSLAGGAGSAVPTAGGGTGMPGMPGMPGLPGGLGGMPAPAGPGGAPR